MKFSPKPILRGVRTFLRKNDTKILKIAAYGVSIVGGIFAVKGGMEANEEIRQKEAELKESTQNPEATLPTKEKAKIVVKKVLPGGAIAIGGVVLNEWCFHILNKKLVVASAISEYATARNLFYNSADEQNVEADLKDNADTGKLGIVIPKELDLQNWDIEFDVFEPISGQTIHHMTIKKLILSEYVLNKTIHNEGQVYLDHLIAFMGGHRLYPAYAFKYLWQIKTDITEYGLMPLSAPWISFMPTLDGDRLILRFSEVPYCLGENRFIDEYNKDV